MKTKIISVLLSGIYLGVLLSEAAPMGTTTAPHSSPSETTIASGSGQTMTDRVGHVSSRLSHLKLGAPDASASTSAGTGVQEPKDDDDFVMVDSKAEEMESPATTSIESAPTGFPNSRLDEMPPIIIADEDSDDEPVRVEHAMAVDAPTPNPPNIDINAPDETNRFPLIRAAESGDLDEVKRLLDLGANIDIQDFLGRTPLMQSTHHEKVALFLLEKGANIFKEDYYGTTALMHFAFEGSANVVKAILSKGANVDFLDKLGRTALMYAARNGNSETAEQLLLAKANVNARDIYGVTAVMFAVEKNKLDLVKNLVKYKADVNKKDSLSQLLVLDASKMHLQGGKEVVSDARSAFARSIGLDRLEIFKFLLPMATNVDELNAALKYSYGLEDSDIRGAIQRRMSELLQIASALKVTTIAHDNQITSSNQPSKKQKPNETGHNLQSEESVDEKDDERENAIDLESKEKALWKDENRKTALMYAAESGNLDLVKQHLRYGAKVTAQDDDGWTALMHAAQNGQFDVVKFLLPSIDDVSDLNPASELASGPQAEDIKTEIANRIQELAE